MIIFFYLLLRYRLIFYRYFPLYTDFVFMIQRKDGQELHEQSIFLLGQPWEDLWWEIILFGKSFRNISFRVCQDYEFMEISFLDISGFSETFHGDLKEELQRFFGSKRADLANFLQEIRDFHQWVRTWCTQQPTNLSLFHNFLQPRAQQVCTILWQRNQS